MISVVGFYPEPSGMFLRYMLISSSQSGGFMFPFIFTCFYVVTGFYGWLGKYSQTDVVTLIMSGRSVRSSSLFALIP